MHQTSRRRDLTPNFVCKRSRSGPSTQHIRHGGRLQVIEDVHRLLRDEVAGADVGPLVPCGEDEWASHRSGAASIVIRVADEQDLLTIEGQRVEHRPELLRSGEPIGEERDLGCPAESKQLRPAGPRVFVGAHRPSIEPVHELVDTRERLAAVSSYRSM